jgi:putative addiction module killer protein
MVEVRRTEQFSGWLRKLRDSQARARIIVRIQRMEEGNLGDVKSVREGVSELRINYGPGYRVYLVRRGETVIILLCGGDKSTQQQDIRTALILAKEV